jgi:hypothetical protein
MDLQEIKAANLLKRAKLKQLRKNTEQLAFEIEQKKNLVKEEQTLLLDFLKSYSMDCSIYFIAKKLSVKSSLLIDICKENNLPLILSVKNDTTLQIESRLKNGTVISDLAKEFDLSRQRIEKIKNKMK